MRWGHPQPRSGEAGEHIAAAGCTGFDVLRLIADLLELLGDPVRALGLASRGLGFAGVGGVEPDQPADNLDHIVAESGPRLGRPAVKGHNPLSYHCLGRLVGELAWVRAGGSDSLSCQLSFGLVRVAEWQTR